MIIADENLEQYWINLLRQEGFEVYSIRETHQGVSDNEVAAIAKEKKGILLTEDKDFGELVFAHGLKDLSVIFLRYDQPKYETVKENLLSVIKLFYENEGNVFITVTENKTRIRRL
jgi:predicted nuclease of predicted toxin-antitoxin system